MYGTNHGHKYFCYWLRNNRPLLCFRLLLWKLWKWIFQSISKLTNTKGIYTKIDNPCFHLVFCSQIDTKYISIYLKFCLTYVTHNILQHRLNIAQDTYIHISTSDFHIASHTVQYIHEFIGTDTAISLQPISTQ